MDLDLPHPSLGLVVTTQAFLGVLSLAGLAAVALLPGFSANVATSLPEYADLRGPLLAVAIALTTLGLVALAMVALLVHRIYTGSPFIALVQTITCLTLVALACITLVLRSLLRNAIVMRSELDEVV